MKQIPYDMPGDPELAKLIAMIRQLMAAPGICWFIRGT